MLVSCHIGLACGEEHDGKRDIPDWKERHLLAKSEGRAAYQTTASLRIPNLGLPSSVFFRWLCSRVTE
jgi:hypothetical protein